MSETIETPEVFRLFKSRAQMMGYVFAAGKTVHFMNHAYVTSDPDEIKELDKECKKGNPNFYVDDKETVVSDATSYLDPLAGIKQRIREEERAKIVAEMTRDMGTTPTDGKLQGIANTLSIRQLQSNSNSGQTTSEVTSVGSIKAAGGVVAQKIG